MFKMVSIIIPALNEERNIGKCLKALSELNESNLDIEVIVIDNGSTDATVDIANKFANLTLIKPGVNISALRNYGVAHSKGDLLAFVDADCIVSRDWIESAINCMTNESADAVGSYYAIPEDATWIGKTMELMQRKKIGADVTYIPAGNILIKRSCFLSLSGFDESLVTNEDVDFCHRLKNSGYRLISDPLIKSVHLGTPNKIKDIFVKQIWHGTNTITIFLRDIKMIRNLRIVLYSCVNLIFLLGIIIGLLLVSINKPSLFAVSLGLYLFLNFTVALSEWQRVRKNFLHIFIYIIIYGLARSTSTLKWIMRNLFRRIIVFSRIAV